jgi:predicted dehydrogenase
MSTRTRVAIVGCGNIAGHYAKDLASYPELELAGAFDLDAERAAKLTATHGGKVYPTLEALLADPTLEIVVNLTIHHAHFAITKQCLEAGKHVFTEKPLALTPAEAHELVRTAERCGRRLGSSPFTWMGEAQQTAWKLIREGQLGQVRLVYAEVNHGRIESWHPNPEPFYAVGPWFDVGVYPLTLLTTFFGPAQWVQAHGQVLYPDRITKEQRPFHIDTPDCMLAIVGLAGGQIVRLSVNFYVRITKQVGIEFQGDAGAMHLGSWQGFHGELSYGKFGEALTPVTPVRPPFQGTEWGRGIRDLAAAIRENRPHRATGAQAAHVVDILAAGMESSRRQGQRITISSTFPQPAPLEWA